MLLRIGKFLSKPRHAVMYREQKDVFSIHGYGDSDGKVDTRKSTSAGMICLGEHVVKSWSRTQSAIALSTGEAELYALNKAAAQSLGLQSLLADLGVNLDLRLHTDATTGRAIALRKGLGKVKLQERVALEKVTVHKIKNKLNLDDILTNI